jgi:SET family sugar efflux transporter-like MFS transporter
LRAFHTILQHPTLRLIGLMMLFLGMHNASVYPYQSLIAIERIGLSKPTFSLLLVVASVASVSASVLFGVLSDQYGHRRRIAIVTGLCSTTAIAMIILNPGTLTFWIGQGILLPMAWSIYGQLFTLARIAAPNEGAQRDAVLGSTRSLLSVGFLATLMFWTGAFAMGAPEMAVYLTGGLASLAMSLAVLLGWPKDGQPGWADTRSGQSLARSFAEIAHPHILSRLIFIGMLSVSGAVFFVLISLVFEASPVRDAGDVALYIGMVAGWEVPFMLILPRFTHRMPRAHALALSALVYAAHLALIPVLCDTPLIWALPILCGAGGAVILMLPIAYYQDLVAGRPGTAAALLALQKLVVDSLTAGVFALGSAIGGFGTVAAIGVGVALTGAACLYMADRTRWLEARA